MGPAVVLLAVLLFVLAVCGDVVLLVVLGLGC